MGDILSQDEIDALLSGTDIQLELCARLKNKGLSNRQFANVNQYITELAQAGKVDPEAVVHVMSRVIELLGDTSLSDRDREQFENLIHERLAEAIVEIQTGKKETGQMADAPSQRIVTSYDFKHPARVNKDQLRTLENLHDNFARLLSSTFSGAFRAVVDCDTAFVDQTTYAEFIMSLSNPSCSYQFTLGPTNGQAILDFAMPVVFGTIDRTFGGKGSSKGVDARQLSQVEMGIFAKIVKRAIEDLEATWEPILQVEISDIELETNPEFMQITAASEIVILLAFELNSTNMSGLVSLCYPFFTLESILPRLGQQTYVRQGRQNRDELIAQNKQRLYNTYVPLSAEFARGRISIDEARQVQVGDVLEMETGTDEPAVIFVSDEPKFLGLPYTNDRGRNAVKISEVLPWQHEEIIKNRSRNVAYLDTE